MGTEWQLFGRPQSFRSRRQMLAEASANCMGKPFCALWRRRLAIASSIET